MCGERCTAVKGFEQKKFAYASVLVLIMSPLSFVVNVRMIHSWMNLNFLLSRSPCPVRLPGSGEAQQRETSCSEH